MDCLNLLVYLFYLFSYKYNILLVVIDCYYFPIKWDMFSVITNYYPDYYYYYYSVNVIYRKSAQNANFEVSC